MGNTLRKLLAFALVVAFALVAGLALLVPLYTDEIVSWLQLTRGVTETGGQGSTLLPICKGTFVRALPLSVYPAAIAYRFFLGGLGLFGVRVSSLAIVGGWFVGVFRSIRGRGFASFVALHALGTFPLAMVTARGEPVMLVALGVLATLPLASNPRRHEPLARRMVVAALFLLTTSVLFATHPRALFYTPFVLLSAAFTFGWRRGRRAWLLLIVALVLFTSGQAYRSARELAECPNAPRTDGILRSLTLSPRAAIESPMLVARNLGRFAEITSDAMSLEPKTASWIPHDDATWLPADVASVADRGDRIAIIGLCVAMPLFVLFGVVRSFRRPRLRRRAALAGWLLVGVLASVALNNFFVFYNASGVLPVLALACLLVLPAIEGIGRGLIRVFATALQLAALASLVMTAAHFGPKLVALARRPTTIFTDRPATVPALHGAAERTKIRAHAATCGIEGDRARHLVIDDSTLFAFDDLHEPIHVIYVTDAAMWGFDFPGAKDVALLQRLGATGLITRCMYLPTALAAKAHRAGDYCCVGADEIRVDPP